MQETRENIIVNFLKNDHIISAVFILLFLFVGYKEYTDEYTNSWFYRTFLQDGFNAEITVDIEFDGKPYKIKRVVRCVKQIDSGEWGHKSYKHVPEYMSFGTKVVSGEGVIVTTPNICMQNEVYKKKWVLDVPKDYLPLLSVADNADDPSVIIIYASRQAYKVEPQRLEFVSLKIEQPQGLKKMRWGKSKPDQFRFFGESVEYLTRHSRARGGVGRFGIKDWIHYSFAVVTPDVWDVEGNDFDLTEEMIEEIKSYKTVSILDSRVGSRVVNPWIYRGTTRPSFEAALYGFGVAPGPTLSGFVVREAPFAYYFDHIVPFELKDGRWQPDFTSMGQIKLYNPDNFTDTAVYVAEEKTILNEVNRRYVDEEKEELWHYLDYLKIRIDGMDYDIRAFNLSSSGRAASRVIYSPISGNLFVRIFWKLWSVDYHKKPEPRQGSSFKKLKETANGDNK